MLSSRIRTRAVVLLLPVLLATACTDDEIDRTAASPTLPSSSSSYDALPDVPRFDPETERVTLTRPAFDVSTSSIRGRGCYDSTRPDLATFDYTWSSAADVTVTGIDLIQPVGVELVGPALTIPPTNPGGRAMTGGEAEWATRAEALSGIRDLRWSDRERVASRTFSADETGVFLLHLRLTDSGSSRGLRVSYTVTDLGKEYGPYITEVRNRLRWQLVEPGQRCRL